MAMLPMEFSTRSSWLNPATNAVERCKLRHTSISSAKQISLAHCGSWRHHNLSLRVHRNRAVSHPALVVAVTGKPTTTTLNVSRQSRHQHELSHSGCAVEETMSYCESDHRRKSLKNLKRISFYLLRDPEVALHSVMLAKESHAAKMIPGLQPSYNSWYSISDLMSLKRLVNHTPLPLTIPASSCVKGKKWEIGVGVGEDLPVNYKDDDPSKQLPQRRCGILLHPTSLPGPHGTGDLGRDAYRFVDWLQETGCTVWQVLPLVPPGRRGGEDGSPYAGADANCCNTLLISLEELVKDGLLERSELPKPVPVTRMNSSKVSAVKDPLITIAGARLVEMCSGKLKEDLEKFRKDAKISTWLEEAALFAAIDQSTKAKTWWTWPKQLRDRDSSAMEEARVEHESFIDNFVAAQFLFQRQWQALHKYANDAGIKILGDMPIYVGGHSADVWAHRSLFELDAESGAPKAVSGVPPDAFSATGQLWGSPLYNWKEMAKDEYSWWTTRLRRAYELYDEFRIDHFRGFAGYWSIPATAQDARKGKWKAGPGKAFFTAMNKAVGKIDIVAEDLGVITGDVVALRKDLQAPGMAVLQFAYGDNFRNPHLSHNHELEQLVYTGTHDNDTCVGWWKKATEKEKERAKIYLRFQKDADVHWEFIRGATASVARTSIIPMQDVMGLDNDSRMNIPATQAGNWGWRIGEGDVFEKLEKEKLRLRKFLCRYNRLTREFQENCKADEKRSKRGGDSGSVGEIIAKSLEKLTSSSTIKQQVEKVVGKSQEKPKEKPTQTPRPKETPLEKLREKSKDIMHPKDDKSSDKSKKTPNDKPKNNPEDSPMNK